MAIDKLKSAVKVEANGEGPLEDSLMLAYIGDGVYTLFIRNRVVETGITKTQILHDVVTSFINAKAQAKVLLALEPSLTEDELLVAKRARNSNVHVPKSASVQEYRMSTAFEALLGYTYRKGDEERLQTLMQFAFDETLSRMEHERNVRHILVYFVTFIIGIKNKGRARHIPPQTDPTVGLLQNMLRSFCVVIDKLNEMP